MFTDKIFLLSHSEVDKFLTDKEKRKCKYECNYRWWWLRSPGDYDYGAAYVGYDGYLCPNGYDIVFAWGCVRPALHLNLAYFNTLEHTEDGCVCFAGREWLVLDKETGMLLAKDGMCFRCFDEYSNNYEHSEIRKYLNDEFLTELFTEEERKMILDTVIDGETCSPADDTRHINTGYTNIGYINTGCTNIGYINTGCTNIGYKDVDSILSD